MSESTAIDNNRKKVHYHDVIRDFRIENNILIGKDIPINREPVNISEVLLRTLKSKPNCVGQVEAVTGKQNTYADMSKRSIKCALWLKKQDIKPGDIIGMCCDNDTDNIIVMLATMYVGAISNPWDHDLSPMTARYFLSLTSPKIVFAMPSSVPSLEEAKKELKINTKIVVFHELNGYESVEDTLRNHDIREITEFKCTQINSPDDVALIVLSSGTTGMPKGTEISHSSLHNCLLPEKVTELEGHICLMNTTLRWHYGVQLAFHAILAYATNVFIPYSVMFGNDDEAMCRYIEKYQVTWLSTVASTLTRFNKTDVLKKYRLLSLKEVVYTGSHLKKEHYLGLAEKLPHAFITTNYGSTDSAADVTVMVRGCKIGSVGFVVPNVQIKITDKTGKTLGANQNGELRLKLPSVMNGYHKRPEETKRAFDSDGWLLSGDIGYYDNEGNVFLIDRISEFLIFCDIHISTAEIELVLQLHPAVSEVAVIGLPHETEGQWPMAVISRIPGKMVTEEELHDLVRKNLPNYCQLRGGIKFFDKLPRTATGKIAKKQLRDMFINPFTSDYSTVARRTRNKKVILKMCERNTATKKNEVQESKCKTRIKDNILLGPEHPIHRESENVAETILKTLKSKPDCIGQIDAFTNKQNTYAEMSERSIKCALWLKKQGVKPGDIIGLCTDNNLDAMIVLLGIMYVNGICNTWDHELSLTTARYFLSLTSPTIVFTIPLSAVSLTEAAKELKMDVKIVVLDKLEGYESLDDILKGHNSREIAEFKCAPISNPDEVGLIVLSSGTTGMPKATEISHSSMHNRLLPTKVADMSGHICLFTPTIRWQYGVMLALRAILACSTRIVAPDSVTDDDAGDMYCDLIEKHRVTWFATDPFVLIQLIKTDTLKKYKLSTLKTIITSGSIFPKEHQEALRKRLPNVLINNGYGSTDSGGELTGQDKNSKPGSVGYLAHNVQIKLTDTETEEVLGANKVGEIRVKVPFVMNGYHRNPEATKKAFDADGWLCTGDLGYYDDDGELFVVGRISDFILFRSINVSPAEIEAVLENHPAVLQAAVIGVPHEIDEQRPMAVVSVVSGKTVTEEELISLVEENLPDHCKLRAGVKFMDELPHTTTGKIAKKKLRKMFAN
ncbi:uncharacterized protein LOC105834306 [Monomorium pharaonis]|uniref:uncharacterized protein LOC105834306 n=1 Tax=Monomorium pharaonis TaxID=307658 RepID=UPI0017479E3F|nr:uncharacterized protein LOC105834306 [Monomorium pharaonis]